MAADITLERTQYPARIRVMDSSLGYPTLWIDDGCFDVAVRLTQATARALAEQLLAHAPRSGYETSGTADGERMQLSSEPEVSLHPGQPDR